MAPPSGLGWAASHAALPILHPDDRGAQSLYFTSRDANNRAHIGRAALSLDGVPAAVALEPEPILGPGPQGAFDDSGVTGSCLVRAGDALHLYYTGWTLAGLAPFRLEIGCAVSADGGRSFRRVLDSPVAAVNDVDPVLTASPSILVEGGVWRIWYVSGTGWSKAEKPEPSYHIRYAESADGLHWKRDGRVCLDYHNPAEHAFGRPHVVRERGIYRMWFCVRGAAYRLGYAESADGFEWERLDHLSALPPSRSGWDSEMIAYPHLADVGEERWLLYNGNGYGRTGIGYAVGG